MKKNIRTIFFAVAILWFCISLFETQAFATTVNVLDGNISVTDTANSNTLSSGTVTIKAKGGLFSKKTNTITIKNETNSTANISFSYSATTYNSFKIAGAAANASGTYSNTLDSQATVTIELVSNSGLSNTTATLILSNFSCTEVDADATATVIYDSIKGSVSLGGSVVTNGGSANATNGTLTAVATPFNGYTFVGWVNYDTHELMDTSANATLNVPQNMNVQAVFVKSDGTDVAWFLVDSKYMINDLTSASTLGKTIVLANNGTVSGDYTIPSGVTLLIPFDNANTLYTTTPGYVVEANAGGANWSKPSFYRTLTMANGANITVNGAICLSAKHSAQFGFNGMPIGAVSRIHMNSGSSITVNSGAKLYAWGYITGSGGVTAKNGSTVYENFQLKDWRGGSQTTSMKNGVFPMSQYYFQNIEVPLTVESGAKEIGVTTASLSLVGNQTVSIDLFNKSGALFNITSGSVTKDYLEGTDQLSMEINGDLAVSEYTLQLSIYRVDSGDYIFPIPSHFKIHAKSGSITVNQDISFYPGSEFVIDSGAAITVGSGHKVYIYGIDQWGNYCYYGGGNVPMVALDYAPGRTCAVRTADSLKNAVFCVNGTLSGNIYTSEGDANVYSSGNGKVIQAASSNATIHQIRMNLNGTENDEYDAKTFTPAVLQNVDTSKVSGGANTYTYTDGFWRCQTHTGIDTDHTCDVCGYVTECSDANPADHICDICGQKISDCADSDGDFICDTCGANLCAHANDNSDHKCDICGCVMSDCSFTVQGELKTQGTCVTETLYEAHCSVCGAVSETITIPGEKVPNNHTGNNSTGVNAKAATCTEKGYTGDTVCECKVIIEAGSAINALGHKYTSKITSPACESEGYTTHTCDACGDTYTDSVVAALGHNYKKTDSKAATCTEDGYEIFTCENNSSHTYTNTLTKTGHEMTYHEAVEPNCTVDGTVEYWSCSKCNKNFADTEGAIVLDSIADPATGHPNRTTNIIEATCTETGLKTITCDDCSTTISTEVLKALGHSYESKVTTEPTCTKKGIETFTCTCGETYTREIDATGHTNATREENRVEATCSEAGSYDLVTYCSVCDEVINTEKQIIEATGHSYGDWTTVTEAGCESAGEKRRDCVNCEHYETETLDATGHDMIDVEGKEATCTTDGYTVYKDCSKCDHIEGKEVIPASHKFEQAEAKEKTCTEDGWAAYEYCTACTYTTKVVEEATGHDMVTDAAKEATCTETGLTEGSHCTRCDEATTAQEVVPAKGHTNGAVVKENEVKATCGTAGSYDNVIYCSVCGAEVEREKVAVEATGEHTYSTETERVNATCTADGYYIMKCACGATEKTTLTQTGHDYESTVTAPTHTEAGYTTYTCAACGDTYTEAGDAAVGHNHTSKVTKEPTCTEKGVETFTCTCGDAYTKDIAALDHDMVTDAAKEATCTETGLTEGSHCTRCDEAIAQEVIPAKGHTNGAVVKENEVEATCGTAGSYDNVIYCSVCGTEVEREKVNVEATGDHTYSTETERVNATCTADGYYIMKCACGATEKTTLTQTGHDYESTVTVPTHTEAGYTTYTCAACGDTYTEDGEAAVGHSHISKVTKEPTCTEKGVETFTCTCGDAYTKDIDALDHDMVTDAAKEATCTETGLTEGSHCTRCDKATTVQEVVPAKGHTNATREENRVEATCGKDGSYNLVTYCSECDTVIKTENQTIAATGNHGYGDWEVTKEASCTKDGSKQKVCSICSDVVTETIAATNHVNKQTVEGKDATCTEEGLTSGEYCPACETWLVEQTVVEATGHEYKDYGSIGGDLEMGTCHCGDTHTRVTEKGAEDKIVTIVPTQEDTSANVTVNTDLLKDIADDEENTLSLHLQSDLLEMIFDNKALKKIITDHSGKSEVSIIVEDTTPEETTNKRVFDIHLAVDGKKQDSSQFGEGKVAVTIPLKGLSIEKNQIVKVYFVDGSERTEMTEGYEYDRDNQKVTFQTNHFSEYEVEVVDAENNLPTIAITKPANGTEIFYNVEAVENGYILTLTATDTTKAYAYHVKYTDAEGNVSGKIANTSGKYGNGEFAIPAEAVNVTVESTLFGDVNNDTFIDSDDALLVLKSSVGSVTLSEMQMLAADVNSDTYRDSDDALLILKFSVGTINKF